MSTIMMTKNEMMTTYRKVGYVLDSEHNNPFCCARYALMLLKNVMLKADEWQRKRCEEDDFEESIKMIELEREDFLKVCTIEQAIKSFDFFTYQIEEEDQQYNKSVFFIKNTLLKIYCYHKTELNEDLDKLDWAN